MAHRRENLIPTTSSTRQGANHTRRIILAVLVAPLPSPPLAPGAGGKRSKGKWHVEGDKYVKMNHPLPKDLTPSEMAVIKTITENKSKKLKKD